MKLEITQFLKDCTQNIEDGKYRAYAYEYGIDVLLDSKGSDVIFQYCVDGNRLGIYVGNVLMTSTFSDICVEDRDARRAHNILHTAVKTAVFSKLQEMLS